MKILQIIIFNLFLCFSSFGQWEYLGTANLGRVLKLESDNGNLYALTYNGIYKSLNGGESWTYLSGSGTLFNQFMVGISDFHVSGGHIFVVLNDDTCQKAVHKSSDDGKTWTLFISLTRQSSNLFIKGDTLQYVNDGTCYVYTDNFSKYDDRYFSFYYEESSRYYFYEQSFYCKEEKIHRLEKTSWRVDLGKVVAKIPEGFRFQQLINGGGFTWVWISNETESQIYRLNQISEEFIKVFSFKPLKYSESYCSFFGEQGMTYKDNSLSFILGDEGSKVPCYFSDKDGMVWDSSLVVPSRMKYFFDSTFYYVTDKAIYSSQVGDSIVSNKTKGIFSPNGAEIKNAANKYFIQIEPEDNLLLNKDTKIFEPSKLKQENWYATESGKIFSIVNQKLMSWNDVSEIWDSSFVINNQNVFSQLVVYKNLMLITSFDAILVSTDDAKTWAKTNLPTNTYGSIVEWKGSYHMVANDLYYESVEGVNWVAYPLLLENSIESNNELFVANDKLCIYSFPDIFSLNSDTEKWESVGYANIFYYYGSIFIPTKERTFFLVGRRSVSYSNDLGKNWDYIDLGLESKVNFDMKLIGDSLYVLNSNGLYRRNIKDIFRLVGTNNDDAELNIGLSPNPVSQNLTISLPNSLDINMKIIDINGRISFQETIKNKATFDVDFGPYLPGMYIIQMKIDGKMIAKKVVKI